MQVGWQRLQGGAALLDEEAHLRSPVRGQLVGQHDIASTEPRREPLPHPLTASWSTGRTRRHPYYHCRRCPSLTVRKDGLEGALLSLLETLRPDPAYLRLFKEVVLDVWTERQTETAAVRAKLERRPEGLQQRRGQLDEAFIYREPSTRPPARCSETSSGRNALAELELHGTPLEALDVEGLFALAEHVVTDAARL